MSVSFNVMSCGSYNSGCCISGIIREGGAKREISEAWLPCYDALA